MNEMSPSRLRKADIHKMFVDGLGNKVAWHSDKETSPLLVDLGAPSQLKIRAYLFNGTNPSGGRVADEYKVQIILPGQKRGERGTLDYSEGRLPILGAFIQEGPEGVFVLWDADMHEDFSYSCNMQAKLSVIMQAIYTPVAEFTRQNNEKVLAARPQYLYEAILRRVEIRRMHILGRES